MLSSEDQLLLNQLLHLVNTTMLSLKKKSQSPPESSTLGVAQSFRVCLRPGKLLPSLLTIASCH